MDYKIDDLGDGYRFTWTEHGVRVDVEHLREAREGRVLAEITVVGLSQPNPGLLHHGDLYLTSTSGKETLIKALPDYPEVNWASIVTSFTYVALKRWQQGVEPIDLRGLNGRSMPRWLLEPFVIHGGPTDMFGEGGSLKSTIADVIAVVVASGRPLLGIAPTSRKPVLYLDWETDEETHGEMIRAIMAGASPPITREEMLPIYYRSQAASLASSAHGLRKWLVEKEVGLSIMDSRGVAAGGELTSDAATLDLFRAVRKLAIPSLIVDHVSKETIKSRGKRLPYGNVYAYNVCRVAWSVIAEEEAEAGSRAVLLQNVKLNSGRPGQRRAYRFHHVNDDDGNLLALGIESTEAWAEPGLSGTLKLQDQIAGVLHANREPMTVDDIVLALEAEGLEGKKESVAAKLRVFRGRRFASGPKGWTLLAEEGDR